jgi:hypothetical protein
MELKTEFTRRRGDAERKQNCLTTGSKEHLHGQRKRRGFKPEIRENWGDEEISHEDAKTRREVMTAWSACRVSNGETPVATTARTLVSRFCIALGAELTAGLPE